MLLIVELIIVAYDNEGANTSSGINAIKNSSLAVIRVYPISVLIQFGIRLSVF